MEAAVREHIKRLKDAAFDRYDLNEIPRYLVENTYLDGDRYSFKDHEYQLDLLADTSRVVYAQKAAQIGITEAMIRYGLGITRLIPYFNTIMTWPTSTDAENMVKTRINPVIQGSSDLLSVLDPDLDNVQIKSLGTSLLYARGTKGETAALSVPADLLIHDEVDRSDPHTLAQYQSRLKHSKYKMMRAFGTPTIDGVGIALLMETAQRKHRMCRCDHCNHRFVPNYETDVQIPGWDRDKKEIDKYNLPKIRWQEAILLCPRCFKVPSLQPENCEWVVENSGDNYEAIGYYLTPFCAPNLVSMPSLVRESTVYTTYGEFRNQALGLTTADDNEQLTKADIESCQVTMPLDSSEIHYFGADMGLICHITIGRMTLSGELLVVHKERVVMGKFEERKRELCAKYKVLISVCDAYPYTDMILRMQHYDKNLYGGLYHDKKNLAVYKITKAEEDQEAGKLPINRADIHRNLNFDEVMQLFKKRKLLWYTQGTDEDEIFTKHLLDMKRKQEMDKQQGIVYVWAKSTNGNDHYHHALGYLHVACRLAATADRDVSFGSGVPLVSSFLLKRH